MNLAETRPYFNAKTAPIRATQDAQNTVYRFSGGIGGAYTPLGGATQGEQQTDAVGGVSDPVHVPAPQRPSPL